MMTSKKNRILIVDDDPTNILILEEILVRQFEICSVSNGCESIEVAVDFKPDIILLDIMMPVQDGYEICRRLRKKEELAFTKIILLSAKSMLNDRLKGYQAGADDFIVKPFDSEELLAKVRVFIRLKSVQEIDRMKDDLINLFSHETRTPLNAIVGFGKILSASEKLGDHERECVDHIVSSGIILLELVNKTILLSNLRNGSRTVMERKTSFETIVEKAVTAVEDKTRAKNIILLKDCREGTVPFRADEDLLVTALSFVLENAAKYSPYLGTVEVNVRKTERGLACDVKDNGKGLADVRNPEKFFSEFYVEDVEHHGRGHGLSLVIVKQIVLLHGGAVTAANNKGEPGCTFTIEVPSTLFV
ncbi:MAG: hybrid sensor histidine kinase/response regulator [Victivallales bacterium]